MEYRVLAPHLQQTADAAAKALAESLGLKLASVRVESEIHPSVFFVPTLSFITNDKHIICIEVLEKLYPPEINDFLLGCRNHSVPVKLYCIIPTTEENQQVDLKKIQFAKDNGIGIVQINPVTGGANFVNNVPISLSLGGLRPFRLTDYPEQYRDNLNQAIQTFKGGNPAKGLLEVYQEIEQITRRVGLKISAKNPAAFRSVPNFDWDSAPWNNILEFLKKNLDLAAANCPDLKAQLWNRILGVTDYRNEVGHKPKTLQKLIDRDTVAKTRFEAAMDILLDLTKAVKPLKLPVRV